MKGTRQHRSRAAVTWVVYEFTALRQPSGARGVCEESEWDATRLARPGQYLLVLAGIASEPEAEKLARGTAGERPRRLTGALMPR